MKDGRFFPFVVSSRDVTLRKMSDIALFATPNSRNSEERNKNEENEINQPRTVVKI